MITNTFVLKDALDKLFKEVTLSLPNVTPEQKRAFIDLKLKLLELEIEVQNFNDTIEF